MPRAYRHWSTPLALVGAAGASMLVALAVSALATRCDACALQLHPVGSDRILVPRTPAVVATAGLIAMIGGILMAVAVRPVRTRLLFRSAALQTALAAVGPLALLHNQLVARMLLVLLLATASFVPALTLSGVAYLRHPRYRPIPRRWD